MPEQRNTHPEVKAFLSGLIVASRCAESDLRGGIADDDSPFHGETLRFFSDNAAQAVRGNLGLLSAVLLYENWEAFVAGCLPAELLKIAARVTPRLEGDGGYPQVVLYAKADVGGLVAEKDVEHMLEAFAEALPSIQFAPGVHIEAEDGTLRVAPSA